MATRIIGQLELLTSDAECRTWFERFELFAQANQLFRAVPAIPELANDNSNAAAVETARTNSQNATQGNTAVFLSYLDSGMYGLIKSLSNPDEVRLCTYDTLKKRLVDHLMPQPAVHLQRYKFSSCKQVNETVGQYINKLKTIATFCDFENFQERMLDQFIAGMKSVNMKKKLLGEANLTFERAVELALAAEKAEEEAAQMNMSESDVNRVWENRKPNKFKASVVCTRCTLSGHTKDNCKIKCFKCGKTGHVKKNCYVVKKTHNVEEQSEIESQSPDVSSSLEWSVRHVNVSGNVTVSGNVIEPLEIGIDNVFCQKPMVKVTINDDIFLNMEFDSGSSVSVTTVQALCESARVSSSVVYDALVKTKNTLKVANGEIKSILGKMKVKVNFKGKCRENMELYVVEEPFPTLFGRNWIQVFCGDDWLEQLFNGKDRVVSNVPSKCSKLCSSVVKCDQSCNSQCSVDVLGEMRGESSCVMSVVDKDEESKIGKDEEPKIDKDLQSEEGYPLNQVSEGIVTEKMVTDYVESLKHNKIFKPGIGQISGVEAKLTLKEEAQPVFLKARNLPYSQREKVKNELMSLVDQNILEKVESSTWATPIVVVERGPKLRICGDYKSTLNKHLETKIYPLPSTEECFNSMVGGQKFSVIDVKSAYNHVKVREKDKKLTVINTHLGLFQWNRLPYGVSSSSGIFQETMDNTLKNIDKVCCRIDDILISGKDDREHLQNLQEVIRRLQERGFRCNRAKSKFFQDSVVYLGHQISRHGIQPVKSKVADLKAAPAPTNLAELISFLGAVNYYRRYLPNLSSVIEPLDSLRSSPWKWTKKEEAAFKELKDMLCSDAVLTLYDPNKKLKLDTDASSRGLGAVLSHVDKEGERPIEYISRTLSKAEKNYSQIDREALAIVWAVTRFHVYLWGNHFELVTDHKPLTFIFDPKKNLPEMATARITRYGLTLMSYQYSIKYRPTKDHANCDVLSRLPAPTKHKEETTIYDTVLKVTMEEALLDAGLVVRETMKDPILSRVFAYTMEGWPAKLDCTNEEMKEFQKRKTELSTEQGCLIWGNRVIIPVKLRQSVLDMLHLTHSGVSGMKTLARSYVWWPNLNQDLENMVKTCVDCNKFGRSAPALTDHPWCRPTGPYQRIHMDFAGLFQGHMWLLVQDAYSKWPDIVKMNSTKAGALITVLRHIFARTGLPCVVVSDNGPQFTSDELRVFFKQNGIRHIPTPTYHPKSNSIAERLVQSFKNSMKKMWNDSKDLDKNLNNFLLTYRNTPHATTGQTPAIMMYNRTLRSKLHMLTPHDKEKVDNLQADKQQQVLQSNPRTFCPKQPVRVQIDGKEWRPATVVRRLGESSNTYDIEHEGRIIRKHADHIQSLRRPIISLQQGNVSDKDPVSVRGETVSEQQDVSPLVEPGIVDPDIELPDNLRDNNDEPSEIDIRDDVIARQQTDDENVNVRRANLRDGPRVNYKMLNRYGKQAT